VLTGLQPYQHGIRHLFKEQLMTGSPTLAQLMSASGRQTGAVVSCPGLNKWYGMNRGFDHYDDEIPRLADGSDPLQTVDVKKRGTALKRAPLVVERGLRWLESKRNEPFFLFLHFFDTHWPYEPPEWFAPPGANPYEREAHFVDHYVGRLFDRLKEWNLLEETVVIVFSDHGEDLGGWYANDHAGVNGQHPEEEGHGCLLYDATQMVPLVLVSPGLIPEKTEVDTQVRLVDIFPTIVDLFGLTDPLVRAGQSLRGLFHEPGEHRTAYCETFYREEQSQASDGVPGLGPWKGLRIANRYKVILDINTKNLMVYDLKLDPDERQPIGFEEVREVMSEIGFPGRGR
jgi:arylsulfatase A-like enzyme